MELFCDEGTFAEMWTTLHGENPIGFPDYEKKLAHAREQSGEVEAVVTGECMIGGEPACVFFMEPSFMMASMGTAVGEKITRFCLSTRGRRACPWSASAPRAARACRRASCR